MGPPGLPLQFTPTQPHENISIALYLYNPNAPVLPAGQGTVVFNTWSCGEHNPHEEAGWQDFCTGREPGLTIAYTNRNYPNNPMTTSTDQNATSTVTCQSGRF